MSASHSEAASSDGIAGALTDQDDSTTNGVDDAGGQGDRNVLSGTAAALGGGKLSGGDDADNNTAEFWDYDFLANDKWASSKECNDVRCHLAGLSCGTDGGSAAESDDDDSAAAHDILSPMDAVGVGCSCLACTSRSGYNITLVKMAAWYKTNVNQNIDLRQIIVCEGSPFHAAAICITDNTKGLNTFEKNGVKSSMA